MRVIVGGTAGKGSVCRLVEDVLVRSGKSVVTLMSPHVQVVTERIRLNGKLITPEAFGESILKIKEVSEKIDQKPTYYEAIVLAGILYGQESGAEICIGEIGLGGSWDAVNAMDGPRIAALTFVGDDHRDILGPTLEDIAITKSGIFTKDCVKVFSFEQKYRSILSKEADCEIEFVKGISKKLNKKIAQKIVKTILKEVGVDFQKVATPGRWETMPDTQKIILDGAHSIDRFLYRLPQIKKQEGKIVGVCAMAQNHDPSAFQVVLEELDDVIWTTIAGERGFWSPTELAQRFGRGEIEEDPQKALVLARERGDVVLVTGSFYLCGLLRENWYSKEAILLQQTEFPSV